MDGISLPEKILDQQLCTKCENYLSVRPITISPNGDIICGRCPKDLHAVESFYNIIAEKCLFKCINHHGGCKQLLPFAEVEDHEDICEYNRKYDCPLCKFNGSSCKLFHHFRNFHVNSIVQGNTFKEIISFSIPNINSILSLNDANLPLFVATVFGSVTCCNCKLPFFDTVNIYVCPKYHAICNRCYNVPCPKCLTVHPWNSKTPLHTISLKCEWRGCNEITNIFAYVRHKQCCKYRQYKCPDRDCRYVCSLDKLKKHWHLGNLESEYDQYISNSRRLIYWLIPDYNEIVFVAADFYASQITITITEIDPVVPFSFDFTLHRRQGSSEVKISAEWEYKASGFVRSVKIKEKDVYIRSCILYLFGCF